MKTRIFYFSFLLIRTTALVLLLLITSNIGFTQDHIRPKVSVINNIEVNTYNGNLIYSRQDIVAKGNLPVDISFYYNSINDTVDFGYGEGWYFNYGIHYYFDTADNFVLVRNGGREDVYTISGEEYLPPLGIYDQLLEYEAQKFRLTTKDGIKYYFADVSHKKLTGITDPNGNSITLEYSGGFPISISNSSGRILTLTWVGNHLEEIAFDEAVFTYSYEANRLKEVTNAEGFTESYQYLPGGKMSVIADFNSNPVYIEYTGDILVNKVKSCTSEMSFSFVENKSFVINNGTSGKLISCYTYDEAGRVVKISNPKQETIAIGYDENNNVEKFTDPKGLIYQYTYDNNGNLLSANDPSGKSFQLTFNEQNKITSSVDPKGNTTNFAYDDNGNLTSIDQPLNATSNFLYDDNGNVSNMTDPLGNTSGFTWDGNHNLSGINFPIGSIVFTYDNSGNITHFTDANGNQLSFEYAGCSTCGQISKIEINDSIATSYTYDGNGNLRLETDANGNTKEYGYDELDRLNSVSIPAGTTNYQYDEQNNLTHITDANGHSSQFTYDEAGQLSSETDAIGKTASYLYDANGNLVQEIDANGNTISYEYNNLNLMTQRSYPENTDHFSYDELGNLTNVYNNDISISYTYDALSRLISKTVDTWNKTISYTYDEADNRTIMTDPDGGITYYTYDANNRLIVLDNPFGEICTFEYDLGGRITKQNNANGTYTEYFYNNWDWLLSLVNKKSTGEIISKYDYTHDKHGNRLTMAVNDTAIHYYTYDGSHRLTEAVYPWGETESFTYDVAGNRLTHTLNGTSTNYTYNNADQLLTAGQVTFTFDNNGNMTGKTENGETTIYEYNALNRLIKIVFPDGTENSFDYDPFGSRTCLTNKAGQTTQYFLDMDNVLMELDASGTRIAQYTSALGVDSWLSMYRDNQNYTYHKDGLNSTTGLSNSLEFMSASYSYHSFGKVNIQMEEVVNPYTYTGREIDVESNVYYLRSRYYDQAHAIFYSKDNYFGNINLPNSLNKYVYVEGNPINYFDPYGYARICKRPLGGGEWVDNFSSNSTLDKWNIELSHEHIFFNDGNNIGYDGKTGQIKNEKISNYINPKTNDYYYCDSESYDDDLLKQSIENLSDPANPENNKNTNPNSYCLLHPWLPYCKGKEKNNCQDWVERVRNEYYRLQDSVNIRVIIPVDPNEIIGPPGYDTVQWVSTNQPLAYTVLFENDPDFATAPAQNVMVKVPVTANLNMYDFRLGGFGFGSFVFEVPENRASYSNRLDVRDSLDLYVDITAGVNVNTQEAFWLLESIDPATGLPPTDPLAGFLPVNDSLLGNGEGFVNFTIKPKETVQTRDSLLAYASIVFDENAPIETNTWVNIADAAPPTSTISGVNKITLGSYEVVFEGQDDPGGCGISKYQLYFAKNNDPFQYYGEVKADSVIWFQDSENENYQFFSLAIDYTGNKEALKTQADTLFFSGVFEVFAGNDVFICIGDNYQFEDATSTASHFSWSSGGDGTFDDQFILNPTYTPGALDIETGLVTLIVSASSVLPFTFTASDTIVLQIQELPFANSGNDATICENGTHQLEGTAENQSSVLWTTSGDGSFDNAANLNPVYTPGTTDISTGTLALTLTASATSPCSISASDATILNIQKLPLATAGNDATICEDGTHQLGGTAENESNVLWTTSGNGTFDNPTILNPVYTPGTHEIDSGTATLTLTSDATSPCTLAASDAMLLQIQKLPLANAGNDATICEDGTHQLEGAAENESNVLWTTSGNGTFDNPNILDPVYTPGADEINSGTATLILTSDAILPCTLAASDAMLLQIQKLPLANAGNDATTCEDGTHQLEGAAENQSIILWTTSGDGSFDNDATLNPVYTLGTNDISTGTVTLTLMVSAISPCTVSASDTKMLQIQKLPIVNAGIDATICHDESHDVSGGAENAESILWSSDGDGVYDDPASLSASYVPGVNDLEAGGVMLTLTAQSSSPCAAPAIDELSLIINHCQDFIIPSGWSGISSWVEPVNGNPEVIFTDILNDLIILQSSTGMFWPGQNVNTIGVWNILDGYSIKVSNEISLTIPGARSNTNTLQLSTGWNLIPVLSSCSVDVETMFQSSDVVILKEVAGWNIYWPAFGINSLGVVEPGKAYFVLMEVEDEITYPDCEGLKESVWERESNNFGNLASIVSWEITKPNTLTHTIAIPSKAMKNIHIETGEVIAAFDETGTCHGLLLWQNQNAALTLFGDDPLTPEKDGFAEIDQIRWRLLNPESKEEADLVMEWDQSLPQHDGLFHTNGLSAISELKFSTAGNQQLLGEEIMIFPNPAKDKLNIIVSEANGQKIEIINIHGQQVYSGELLNKQTKVDISFFEKGLYFVQITSENQNLVRKVVKE